MEVVKLSTHLSKEISDKVFKYGADFISSFYTYIYTFYARLFSISTTFYGRVLCKIIKFRNIYKSKLLKIEVDAVALHAIEGELIKIRVNSLIFL